MKVLSTPHAKILVWGARAVFIPLLFLAFSVQATAAEKIDINTASLEELQELIGIGPVKAQRIIEARPFSSVHDLIKVNGIGEITLQKIIKQGSAWVSPNLPQTEPQPQTKSDEPAPSSEIKEEEKSKEEPQKELATVSDSFRQIQEKQISKPLSTFLIALGLAIFSGVIILGLKRKLKK